MLSPAAQAHTYEHTVEFLCNQFRQKKFISSQGIDELDTDSFQKAFSRLTGKPSDLMIISDLDLLDTDSTLHSKIKTLTEGSDPLRAICLLPGHYFAISIAKPEQTADENPCIVITTYDSAYQRHNNTAFVEAKDDFFKGYNIKFIHHNATSLHHHLPLANCILTAQAQQSNACCLHSLMYLVMDARGEDVNDLPTTDICELLLSEDAEKLAQNRKRLRDNRAAPKVSPQTAPTTQAASASAFKPSTTKTHLHTPFIDKGKDEKRCCTIL